MKMKDVLGILAVAAATAAFTVPLLGPGRVGATDNPEGIKPRIAQPRLTIQGCVFALKTDRPAYQADEMPVLQIEATNPTEQPVETAVWIGMSATTPPSPLARMLPAPKTLWNEKCLVRLGPGETKTVTLATEAKLPEGARVSITMSDKETAVVARAFSTPNLALPMEPASQAAPGTQRDR